MLVPLAYSLEGVSGYTCGTYWYMNLAFRIHLIKMIKRQKAYKCIQNIRINAFCSSLNIKRPIMVSSMAVTEEQNTFAAN